MKLGSNRKDKSYLQVKLPGGKHSFAHAIAVGALADKCVFKNVPNIRDSRVLIELLKEIYVTYEFDPSNHSLYLCGAKRKESIVIDEILLSQSRNIFCIIPALLKRTNQLIIKGVPKGCNIGERPTDWYYSIMEQFGVLVTRRDEEINLEWKDKNCVDIAFEYPTMTGTVIAYACACAVKGRTELRNCSVEQSCDDEVECMRALGVLVSGNEDYRIIENQGINTEVTFICRCDRVYAATILTAGILAERRCKVYSDDCIRIPRYVEFARYIGLEVIDKGNSIEVDWKKCKKPLKPIVLDAGSEPKYSSDWVPFALMILAVKSEGVSIIKDDVFVKRGQFINCYLDKRNFSNITLTEIVENNRKTMVAKIEGEYQSVIPGGVTKNCSDIRGMAGIVLSAIISEHSVELKDEFQLSRGYEDLIGDLERLGFIERLRSL